MGDHSLFDWVSVLGPVLLSWPLVVAVALVLFYQPVFKLLEKASDRKVQKAKIGPFEIEETEQPYVETLKLLLSSFISDQELTHLQQLEDTDRPFAYDSTAALVAELKRLQTLGFITTQTNLNNLPDQGDLKHYVELTAKGKKYLTLHHQLTNHQLPDLD